MRLLGVQRGTWFLPGADNKVKGRLYSKKGVIYLEVLGPLDKSESFKFRSYEFIHGITYDQKEVTLYKCAESLSSHHDENNAVVIYSVKFVISDGHFTLDNFLFDRANVHLANFETWLDFKPFERVNVDGDSVVKHLDIEKIEEHINDNFRIEINFSKNTHLAERNKLELFTSAYMQITAKDKLSFDAWLDLIMHISSFLSLSYTRYCSIIILDLSNVDVIENYPIHVDGQYFSYENILEHKVEASVDKKLDRSYEHVHFFKMIFLYSHIKNNFSEIINKWIVMKDVISPVLALILENIIKSNTFNENNFLNSIHGVETFHRRLRNNVLLPIDKHKKRVDEILSTVDEKYKEWVKSRIEYGNEPSLHIRLEETIREIDGKFFNKIIPDKAKFITQVKNSRNYYTHYDLRLQKKALKGSELFYLTRKLDYILIFIILKEAGIKPELLNELLLKQLDMGFLFDKYRF